MVQAKMSVCTANNHEAINLILHNDVITRDLSTCTESDNTKTAAVPYFFLLV